MKVMRSINLFVVFSLLVVGTVLVRASATSQSMTAFTDGTFEASGVAHVPGTETVLFVDDGRPNEVFWMRLGEDGKQAGSIKPVALRTSIIDLEVEGGKSIRLALAG